MGVGEGKSFESFSVSLSGRPDSLNDCNGLGAALDTEISCWARYAAASKDADEL